MALRERRSGGDRDAIASLLSRLSCDAREFSFGATGDSDSDSDDDAGDIVASSRENRAAAVPRIAISPEAARSYAKTEASANAYRADTAPTTSSVDPPIVLSPLEFYRDYIAANRPCVITGAVSHWPALSLWRSDQYLIGALGDKKVTVDFTPDGHGDAIVWRDGIGRSDHGSENGGKWKDGGSVSGFPATGGANIRCDCSGDAREERGEEIRDDSGVRRWVLFPGDEGWDSRGGSGHEGVRIEGEEEEEKREGEAVGEEEEEEEEEEEVEEEEEEEAGEEQLQGRERECEANRYQIGDSSSCPEGSSCPQENRDHCSKCSNHGSPRACSPRACSPRACLCDPPCAWFVTPHEASLTLPAFFRLLYSSRSTPSHSPSLSPSHSSHFPTHSPSQSPSFASAHSSRSPFIGIPYVQHQNGSFRTEFAALAADADEHIGFATAALGGNLPEAVNLWIGDERAVTSWHKDHYENFYVVVTGTKTFRLLPPLDVFRMRVREYPAARYWQAEDEQGPFHILPSDPPSTVPWVSVDARLNPLMLCRHAVGGGDNADMHGAGNTDMHGAGSADMHGAGNADMHGAGNADMHGARNADTKSSGGGLGEQLKGPPPLVCTIGPGEMLYLPSMWYHHVSQSPDETGRTIALNYWYDMQFDVKYAYYNLVQSLTRVYGL
ncbi:hypothetical protein CLOM_g1567 [Closterium sp. NIES-68]|nr:hypothetical protein CLOM_g1567 [Closterium sp. NIES-68]GJP85968.1 hypothetical protein CLOP_g16050 [Closterium sp. NIES-67]